MAIAASDIPDLVSRIRQEYPQVGILVISGWTEIKEEVLLRGAQFCKAPIALEEFSCPRQKYYRQKTIRHKHQECLPTVGTNNQPSYSLPEFFADMPAGEETP